MIGIKICLFVAIPLLTIKSLSTLKLYQGSLEVVNLRSLNRGLILITLIFCTLAIKQITSSYSPFVMSLVIYLHIISFLTRDLLMVLLLSDIIICWITLRFRLNHTSIKELVSNVYLIYYIIIPSTPLLIMAMLEFSKGISISMISAYRADNIITFKRARIRLIILLSRMAKMPVFRLHYWLPKAHVQAPTILSIVLARLSLKIRLIVTSFVLVNTLIPISVTSVLVTLLLAGILISTYTRTSAVDSKVFLAYCSVSHITIGCIRVSLIILLRFKGAWLIRLGHCLSSPLLFLIARNTQYRTRSRFLHPSKRTKLTWSSFILLLLLLIDLPFPPTFSFWRELSLLTSLHSIWYLMSCLIIISLVVLIRGYENFYTHIRRFMCSSLIAGFTGSALILVSGVLLV